MEKKNQKPALKKPEQKSQNKSLQKSNLTIKKQDQRQFHSSSKKNEKQSKVINQKFEVKSKENLEKNDKKSEESKAQMPITIKPQEEQKIDLIKPKIQQKEIEKPQSNQMESNEEIDKITCEQCGQLFMLSEIEDHLTAHEFQERPPTNRGQREFLNAFLEQMHNISRIRSQLNQGTSNPNEIQDLQDFQELPNLLIPPGATESFPEGIRIVFARSQFQQNRSESEYELDNDQFDRGKGLNEKQISKIKRQKINKEQAQDLGNCCVCLNEFKEDDLCRKLTCQHIFHMHCIDEWVSRKKYCPICKSSIEI